MSKQTEALKLALEALKELRMLGMNAQWHDSWLAKPNEAITAIREALSEQPAQQEPVAVYVGETWCGSVVRLYEDLPLETPLYTSPPATKPWVGLTEFDIDQIPYSCSHADSRLISYAIEAKLREKNA